MDLRLQQTISNALNGDQFNFNPGRTSGIFMKLTGTADTGQTGTPDDCGSIIVTRGDNQIANVSLRQLGRILDIQGGSNLFSSTEAGAFKATFYLSFMLEKDEALLNALNIVGATELNFEYVPSSTASTVFTSLKMEVYSERSAYLESYEFGTFQNNQNEGGSVSQALYQMNKANIADIYLEDPDTSVSLIQVDQSEKTIVSPVDWDILEAVTTRDNFVEDGASDMVKIQCYSKGNRGSTTNYGTELYYTTSGSGDFPIVVRALKWHSKPR